MDFAHYTITEAAKMLSIHERNVRELIREGQLKTVTIGDKEKITKESVDSVLPGFRDDPNPDMDVKKQKHPQKFDSGKREYDRQSRGKY